MPTSNTHIPHTPSPATQLGSPTFQNPESKTPNRQTKPNLKWLQNFHPINHNSTTALLHHQITQMMPLPTELQKPKPKPPTPQQTKPLHNPNNHTENKNLSPSLPLFPSPSREQQTGSSSGKFAFGKALSHLCA